MGGMATDPHIGTKIREARERKRWTQQQLADALEVSRTTIDAWENGRAYPRGINTGVIEETLGITFSDGDLNIVPPEVRSKLSAVLSGDDLRRVLGVLEGTLTWPAPPAGSQEPAERPAGQAEDQAGG
jgi:transcriptional regulator with XRE-family HTH domain